MELHILCALCIAVANLAATIINANALSKMNRDLMRERRKESDKIFIDCGVTISDIVREMKKKKADTGSDSTCS